MNADFCLNFYASEAHIKVKSVQQMKTLGET